MDVLTSCSLDCPDRCSIVCRMEGGGIRLRGNPDHPYTQGFLCAKIRRYPERLKSPHRIREPWLRKGDHFAPASWELALDTVCEALDRARAEDPASILLVRSNGSMGLGKSFADYVFGLLGARGTFGSLCDAAGCAAIETDGGALRMNDPAQIDAADAIVLWGKNPSASSIHTAAQVERARKRGVPVLAVSPDPACVHRLADRVIRVRPGTDRFLALAVAKIVRETSERGVPWALASNQEAFEALLARWPLSELLASSGVSIDEARLLAATYGSTPRVATIVGWALQRYSFGGENVRAIHALAFVAGTLGIAGGGLYLSVPSRRHVTRPQPPGPVAAPLSLPGLAREIPRTTPPLRCVWFTCSNFLNQGPDAKATREALARVGTVVAVEGFWTETARRATVVLPPALWLEEEDVAASYWHRGIGAVRRVVDPPPECRTDFEILRSVASRLGLDQPFSAVEDWLQACLPPAGPSLDDLRKKGWALFDEPPVAWTDGFAHPDGRIRLVESLSPEPAPDPGHPLRLLTLIRAAALNSQLLPEEQKGPLPVRIHPATAAALGLAPGCAVRVVSSAGELEGEVHLDPDLHPEAAACPRGGWLSLGLGVNEATRIEITDLGPGSAFYATTVRLEKLCQT